ncbi:MAG: 50S ribosomal protein L11 methyltransferase [Rhodospirillales bacterium CG15_BIG_FIL_POST_REV_8_21_14_020_66_15]|nr:MAG: 50S ribosomal protein L11 methyltransferase [Rhodospirillales bacterium CG15_BIG_FIL_POST_REV_8_21_14_020_66_15]
MTGPALRFLWSISFRTEARDVPFLEACLDPLCESVSAFGDADGGPWRVEGIAVDEPDRALLKAALNAAFPGGGAPEPVIDLIPPRDWLKENIFAFPPLTLGRFFIHGSHHDGAVPVGLIPLMLDAGTAFGSGEHGSTAGCLTCLDDLARNHRPARVLDVGCGSGILAIAAAKLWRVPVVATDIDAEAVRVTALNADRNGVGHLLTAVTASGYRSPIVRQAAPYGLIVENILARPIRRLSRDLAHHLAPGGVCILSGLVTRDARLVITAHRRQGLKLVRHVTVNGWRTLVMQKPR